MKTIDMILTVAVFLFLSLGLNAQTFEFASVTKNTYTDTTQWFSDIQYYDGFGRPLQAGRFVDSGMMVTNNVSDYHLYDAAGNVILKSLPKPNYGMDYIYSGNFTSASYESSNGVRTCKGYSELRYDNAPEPRLVSEGGEGIRGTVYYRYLTNDQSEYACCRYKASISDLSRNGNYPSGELHVVEMTDEDGNISYEFKDRAGRVLLSRRMSGTKCNDTYFVYDDKDNLRYVLPPKLSENPNYCFESTLQMQQLGYIYRYDSQNRCIYKKLPGAHPIYYIYDDSDNVIFSQDGNQRERGEWSFSIPDIFGRAAVSGFCKKEFDDYQAALEGKVVRASVDFYGLSSVGGYAVSNVVLDSAVVMSACFYDDYDFIGDGGFGNSDIEYGIELPYEYLRRWTDGNSLCHAKGLLTGTMTAKVDSDGNIDGYRYCAYYYDHRGQVIATYELMPDYSRNLYGKEYDYAGNVISEWSEIHGIHSGAEYSYDEFGRLHSESPMLCDTYPCDVTYTYDSYGCLGETVFSVAGDDYPVAYSYTPNGWLKRKESEWFSMQLCYDDPFLWDTDATHGGKVSEWHWAYDEAFPLAYAFEYDSLSRVVDSWMYDCEMYYDLFAEQNITYDSNGNLTSMRKIDGDYNVELINYSYTGNQLAGCTYDNNGNLTYDPSLGLTFEWNRLNLLQKVSRGDEVLVKYAYLADGTKLSAIDGAGDGFEYIGSLTFRRSGGSRQLESSAFSQGRIYREGSGQSVSYIPYFHITDHLGSVRAVIDGRDGYLVEENHYYPFGERWDYGINPTGLANRYQYNGKEDQNIEFDLPTLDYGARHYSPSTARWLSPDPLAEKYYNLSPYAFCGNDPVNYVDPDGRDWYEDEEGNAKWVPGDEDIHIDLDGKEWKNIGQEYLFFNGNKLHYFVQSKGEIFDAVSGRPTNGDFVYDKASQSLVDEGPIPEGLYYINPQEIQSYFKLSFMQKLLSVFNLGTFPKGPIAWGFDRVWIKPNEIKVFDFKSSKFVTRSNFSLHGGLTPGSAGCIDLSGNAFKFFSKLKSSNSSFIRLNVNYETK